MLRISLLTTLSLMLVSSQGALNAQEEKVHPLEPAIRLAKESLARLQSVKDYEAIFTKKELVDSSMIEQQMFLRFREEPFSIYLKFIKPNAGRETLYVHGKNQNQLRVHEAGGVASLVGTISLPLNSSMVTSENRHPITRLGLRNMLVLLIKQWEYESKYGEIDVKFFPNAKMGDVSCEVIQVTHPKPRKQFKYHLTRLFIDKQTRYPIRIENYGFPTQDHGKPVLEEEYTYTNIKANVGFPDIAFSEENPQYSF